MIRNAGIITVIIPGRGWADPENYDLLINTSTTGIKGSVRMIEEYIKIRGYKIEFRRHSHVWTVPFCWLHRINL